MAEPKTRAEAIALLDTKFIPLKAALDRADRAEADRIVAALREDGFSELADIADTMTVTVLGPVPESGDPA